MIYADLKDERDAEIARAVKSFNEELTLPIPQHDAYSIALRAMREFDEACAFESRIQQAGTVMLRGAIYVSRCDGQPDKPGTVRAPGVRRQFGSNHKQRWSGL